MAAESEVESTSLKVPSPAAAESGSSHIDTEGNNLRFHEEVGRSIIEVLDLNLFAINIGHLRLILKTCKILCN